MLFIFLDFFLKCVFSVYYNHFLFVFWKLKPCIIIWIMQGFPFPIITYQVITGNYSDPAVRFGFPIIITYQVITGNYSRDGIEFFCQFDYNIPSNNRELQHGTLNDFKLIDYNIPSNNRELQLSRWITSRIHIITYQVITGNYSALAFLLLVL